MNEPDVAFAEVRAVDPGVSARAGSAVLVVLMGRERCGS